MIQSVSAHEFGQIFPKPSHVFNTVAFAELNRHKCDDEDVRYLLVGDTKVRAGIILGRHGDTLHTPFSAPFGGLLTKHEQRFEIVDDVWRRILDYVSGEGFRLRVTLPPAVYDGGMTVKSINSLQRLGLSPTLDVSYHLDLSGNFCDRINRSCRKLLAQVLRSDAKVSELEFTEDNIERVYNIIVTNHCCKDRPTRMSIGDVKSTASLVSADFFILTFNDIDVAGSMAYPVGDNIVQVVYWGDMPGYSHLRPMNLLAQYMYDHYKSRGVKILDLGPATEDGVPNYGLCTFKESLGAIPTLKYTFRT